MDSLVIKLIWIWIALGAVVFFVLLFKYTAPYGKFYRGRRNAGLPSRVAWFLMELPSLVIPVLFIIVFKENINFYILLVSGLWIAHYFYRSLVFPLMIKNRRNVSPAIVGLGILFNIINSFFNFYLLCSSNNEPVLVNKIPGVILFIVGFYIHFKSDKILIGLRGYGEYDYKVPQGFLFRYVSCPNYFGEILEWFGWFLIVSNVAGFSFFFWTVINLLPRALSSHKWYKENFENYPENRKALIPFLI